MSLVIITYVPEGIVLASDSRQSITIEGKTPDGKDLPKVDTVNSDSVEKTYLLEYKNKEGKYAFQIGVSSFGQDLLGGISTASHIRRFGEECLKENDDVTTVPRKLIDFFRNLFPTADTGFHVGGYKKEGKINSPYIYYCHVGRNTIERRNLKTDNTIAYGATWSGQIDVLSGILQPSVVRSADGKDIHVPKPAIIWDAMTLQDAIDFSIYAIRTTIDTIRFQARPKNVGGPIDVLVITPEGANWIQKKKLRGEFDAF